MSTGRHVERDAGIVAGQHFAEVVDVALGGVVIFGELHLDVGVGRCQQEPTWSRRG